MLRKSWVVLSPRSRSMTSSSSGVRVAVGPVAAEVDEEEKEAKALVERYVLGSACKVLAGTPVPLGATPLVGGVNFIIYSC
jgi:isoamylase